MNTNTITVNGATITERQIRSQARAIVRRMYGPCHRLGQSLEIERGAFYGPRPEAVVVTVRQPGGRLCAPLQFCPQ